MRQLVTAGVPWARRLRRPDAASPPPTPIIVRATPPAAPMAASPQSKPLGALTRTIAAGVPTGRLTCVAWACVLVGIAGTSDPFALMFVGKAEAGAALAASPSATMPAVMR